MSDKMNSEKLRTVFICACPAKCMACVAASFLSLTIWAENPYAASGGKSDSLASRAYQWAKKSLGMDKSKPPISNWGNGPAFDMDREGEVVDGVKNLKGYKNYMKERDKDYPESEYKVEQKQLKDMGGHENVDWSFNPSVDPWRSDEDIAKAAIYYAGSKDWRDYIKILDASIGYLEQVLSDGKGDASFANWQTEEIIKIGVRITKTIFNAKGWSRKDSARVLKKMIEDYGINDKELRRFNLAEEVEKRGILGRRVKSEFTGSLSDGEQMRDRHQERVGQEKKSDSSSCSCKDPSPNVTVAGRTGWARCDKCNKLIGAVTVDKNGEVHVAGTNQVANEMVKDMVKKILTKDKK